MDERTEENNHLADWADDLSDRLWRQQMTFQLIDSGDRAGIDFLVEEIGSFRRIVRAIAWGRAA